MASIYEGDTWQYHSGTWEEKQRAVIVEQALALSLNGAPLTTLMCTPVDLEDLVLGFIYNEHLINALDEVADLHFCADQTHADIILTHSVSLPQQWRRTSGCTGGVTAVDMDAMQPPHADFRLSAADIGGLVRALFEAQEIYRQTGGVHTSILSDGQRTLATAEDIGRHNSLDKLAGKMLRQAFQPQVRVVATTGRISSEMLQKSQRMGAVVVLSRTSPSSLSVQLARTYGITLIGYARPHRFQVYAHGERILRQKIIYPKIA